MSDRPDFSEYAKKIGEAMRYEILACALDVTADMPEGPEKEAMIKKLTAVNPIYVL